MKRPQRTRPHLRSRAECNREPVPTYSRGHSASEQTLIHFFLIFDVMDMEDGHTEWSRRNDPASVPISERQCPAGHAMRAVKTRDKYKPHCSTCNKKVRMHVGTCVRGLKLSCVNAYFVHVCMCTHDVDFVENHVLPLRLFHYL